MGTTWYKPKGSQKCQHNITDGCCSSVPPIQSSQLHTKPEQLLHRRARCFLDFPGASAKQDVTAIYVAVCQNLVPLVNIKIAGKWMFIPLNMVLIGIDPYLCSFSSHQPCAARDFLHGFDQNPKTWQFAQQLSAAKK